jgi:DNA-directed RNA polymerase specialized sigma24 family protein
MDVDESFAEYVAARWSMLYRLAVLLAGEAGADELTQAALVRVHVSWHEVEEAASADDHVKRILADTAVNEMVRGPQAGSRAAGDDVGFRSPVDRQHLWAAISGLLPRQRAVLVLRHYEGLSDGEIAHALRCSTSMVTEEALALETGIDLAELRDELTLRAEEAVIPLPPVDDLAVRGHQARRQRVRRATGRSVAVAAILVVGLTLASVVQDWASSRGDRARPAAAAVAAPRFLKMLPDGAPPRIAYSVRRSLHLGGGREVLLAEEPSAIVQTKKWLFVAYLSGAIVRVDLATTETETIASASGGELVTDPAGEHLAWLAAGAGPAVVVVQTVADGAVLLDDQQTFPAKPRCCDNPFVVNGMTEGGQVIGSLPAANRAWVWTNPDGGTDNQVREISGLGNGVISQVTAQGIAAQYPPSHYAVGVLEDDAFLVRGEINARQADFGDPHGERVLYADGTGEIHVRERASRGRSRRGSQDVRLGLPALDQGYASVRWEDPDHVLLDVSDASTPDGALVRCEVATGACEIAAALDGPHLLAR